MKPTGDEESDPPGSERSRAGTLDAFVDHRHQQLSGSSSHVPPPSCSPISQSDNLAVEHRAHPVLARHESSQRESDHESDGHVSAGVRHERHAEHGGSREHDEESASVSGTQKVAHRTHRQPREYAPGNGSHAGVPDVAFGEAEVVPDYRDQRSRREGGDETGEEGDPREVEGPHVRVTEREDLEHLRFVLRIDRQSEFRSCVGRNDRRGD